MKQTFKNRENSKSRLFFYISSFVLLISVLVFLLCTKFTSFAESYSRTFSHWIRLLLSKITSVFPFSIGEALIFLILPTLVFCLVLFIVLKVKKSKGQKPFKYIFFGSIFVLASIFLNTYAVCYFRNPLEQNLALSRRELTREEIYKSTLFVKNELENLSQKVDFSSDGSSVNPHSWEKTSELIDEGYDKLIGEYDFISNINSSTKELFCSPILTYTHLSGFYFPFTGEANVNSNYPDYVVAFTVAHEKAHQRGIAGEDDANYVAFLSLVSSNDDYLKYSAYMTMYDYMLDAEYEKDIEMYYYFLENTNKQVFGEMYSYSNFFDKYRDSAASEVANTVNDTYIKIMGDENGTKSYGKVIELFFAQMAVDS